MEKLLAMNIIYIFARITYRRHKRVLREKMQIATFLMFFLYFELYILVS